MFCRANPEVYGRTFTFLSTVPRTRAFWSVVELKISGQTTRSVVSTELSGFNLGSSRDSVESRRLGKPSDGFWATEERESQRPTRGACFSGGSSVLSRLYLLYLQHIFHLLQFRFSFSCSERRSPSCAPHRGLRSSPVQRDSIATGDPYTATIKITGGTSVDSAALEDHIGVFDIKRS